MALTYFKGTLYQMGEVKTGTSQSGREWARMEIVLDIPGYQGTTYKVSVTAGPDKEKVDEVLNFKTGDKVEVGVSIYAREWNGRWFNNLDLVTIKPGDGQSARPVTTSAPTGPVVGLSPEGTGAEEVEDMPW